MHRYVCIFSITTSFFSTLLDLQSLVRSKIWPIAIVFPCIFEQFWINTITSLSSKIWPMNYEVILFFSYGFLKIYFWLFKVYLYIFVSESTVLQYIIRTISNKLGYLCKIIKSNSIFFELPSLSGHILDAVLAARDIFYACRIHSQ